MTTFRLTPMRALVLAAMIGLAIRFILAPFTTGTYDVSSWAGVINGINMGEGLYDTGYYWYAPTWGYVLAFLTPIMDALNVNVQGVIVPELASDGIYNAYSRITIPEFNLIYKTPLIVSDLIVGTAIYSIIKSLKKDDHIAFIAFCLWFLNPLTIWNSSMQGMFETLSILGMVLSIAFLLRGNHYLAGMCIVFAGITKLFPIILVPLMIGYIIARYPRRDALKGIIQALVGGVVMFALIFIPVTLNGDFSEAFAFLLNRVENFDTGGGGFDLTSPSWNNIFSVFPLIIAILIVLAIVMALSKRNLDKRFLLIATFSMCFIFAWPPFPPYHQYALNMVPLLILAYSFGYKSLLIPTLLTSVLFFLAAFFWMGPEMLYPMAAGNLISFDTIGQWMDTFKQPMLSISHAMEYIKFIPGLAAVMIIALRVYMDIRDGRAHL